MEPGPDESGAGDEHADQGQQVRSRTVGADEWCELWTQPWRRDVEDHVGQSAGEDEGETESDQRGDARHRNYTNREYYCKSRTLLTYCTIGQLGPDRRVLRPRPARPRQSSRPPKPFAATDGDAPRRRG